MELQLKYNGHLHQPVNATLLRGNDPQRWLQQISSWHIDQHDLNCFIVPASIESADAAALFVIFNNPADVKNIELLEPYTSVAKRLYIPCTAALFPQVLDKELQQGLLWDVQVFHPTIGLVGFDNSNRIQLSDCCLYTLPKTTDWSFANPGLMAKPSLEKIIVTPASAKEIIDELKENIGQKPIEEIPIRDDEKRTAADKVADGLKTVFFTGLQGMISLFDKLLPAPAENGGFNQGNIPTDSGSGNGKSGWIQKLENWLNKNLADLQKKRNDEVQRLLNLFEHDTDEALQFAIPLDSPYLNRGSQQSSSRLSRNLPKFNLGRLGGGGVVDSWDVGNYYNDLRTKYLKAAQKEIEQKDFKKAAYVYAHLLGDYYSAANVLEQGNLYREAAALHKDHLKNIPAAAKCLGKGGLYLEAIDLYKDLKQDEKVGDLYSILQQQNNAVIYFENCITAKIDNNDYLDAARIIDEKLVQEERAKQTLLQGWTSSHQSEPCLKKYFDIVSKEENAPVENTIREIYQQHTPAGKKLPLLNIMDYLNKRHPGEALLHTTQEIAYEIVHDQAEKGNVQHLHSLRNFLPGDKLIASDTSRYNNHTGLKSSTSLTQHIFLDDTVRWIKTTCHKNQLLVIGIKNDQLQLARVNWYGNTEYYSWETKQETHAHFNFITAPYYSKQIILHSLAAIPVARRNLPKNKYFNEALVVNCPIWLHKTTAQFLISSDNKISRLEISNGRMTLHQYSMDGDLLGSVNCLFDDDTLTLGTIFSNPYLVFNDGYFYSYSGMNFFTVSSGGQSKSTNLQTGIRTFSASDYMSDFSIVISTNKGCTLCKPHKGELNFNGHYFAEKLIPVSIVFITAYRFVIAEKMKATVFEINGSKTEIIHEVASDCPIVGIAPGVQRNQFATIGEDGKIRVHVISDARN